MTRLQEFAGGEVTRLLAESRVGDPGAFERLLSVLYAELRRLAQAQLRREREDHTLQATELVHEAFLKLTANDEPLSPRDRGHFFALAARAMRQVLVDHARRRGAEKRGGGWAQTTLGGGKAALQVRMDELLALDQALDQLEERQRRVLELRFFAGLTEREVADAIGVSERTVRRDWMTARARLYRAIYPDAQ